MSAERDAPPRATAGRLPSARGKSTSLRVAAKSGRAPGAPLAASADARRFIDLFQASIAAAERADGVAALLERVHAHFTRALFAAVCRSLFEKDKLVFALLLAVRVLQSQARARARAVAAAGSCVTHQRPHAPRAERPPCPTGPAGDL